MTRTINNILVVIIIICSTSFYNLKVLGQTQKMIELTGFGLILGLLILHVVYAKHEPVKHNFSLFILFIFISFFTGLFMANYEHDQSLSSTLFAQRAILYYLFYYLLHQMKVRIRDLEWIFISFGILHASLFLLQYFVYPKILFNTFILIGRGTIRIYLAGSDYLAICFFMSMMAFLSTNKIRYIIFMLMSFSIFVMLGGRQTMALMGLILILAVLFSDKVRSRVSISIFIAAGVFLIFILFQPIFQQMLSESRADRMQGQSYVRIRAIKYFLTDFYHSTIPYILGNGAPGSDTSYSGKIELLKVSRGYFIGDIGIIGGYVFYGLFFLIGVLGILIKGLRIKIQERYSYIKYIFLGFLLSQLTGTGFTNMDFVCALCCLLYILDVSHQQVLQENNDENNINPKEHLI